MQTQRREGFVKRLMKKSSNMRHFHHHKANKNTITFHFKLYKPVEDYPGEVMLISGSIPELGNGSIANAARMYIQETPEGKIWKYDLVVPVKELENARMDIAGSYEGNPHGNFFTYNYIVKKPEEKGMSAIEKYESVPRRGIPKSSLMSTNSLGEQVFLNDYSLDHTWSSPSAPNTSTVSKKDLASNDSLGTKAEMTPPSMKGKAFTSEAAPLSPIQPRATTLATDSIPRIHQASSDVKLDRSVSTSRLLMISKNDQELLDRMKAEVDEKDESKRKGMFSWYKNLKITKPDEVEARTESIYSPETERQQRLLKEASTHYLQTSPLVREEEPLPAIPQQEVMSKSPEERRAEQQKIIDNQINLRRSYGSYQKRIKSEEATEARSDRTEEVFIPEMVRIEDEPENFYAAQLVVSDRDRLEHDPLMTAVDPQLKEERFDFNASIEELEQKVIANLKEAEIHRSFSDEAITFAEVPKELDTTSAMEPPMTSGESLYETATSEEEEVSEDVLLDRIEENTPLLAPLDSQLPDVEDSESSLAESGISRSQVVQFSDYTEEPSEAEPRSIPVGSVDPIVFGKIHRLNKEILEEVSRRNAPVRSIEDSAVEALAESAAEPIQSSPSTWTSSFGIDAVLSGKMYRVGQELKQKIFGELGWSNFLQSHKDLQSSMRSFEPVDPIVSGKLHNVHKELAAKVAGKSTEDRNDWLSSRRASAMPIQSVDPIVSGKLHNVHKELVSKVAGKSIEARNEWLDTRRTTSMPLSEPVDPIISGKMHRVHAQLKQKLPESGRLVDFFGFISRSVSFNGINPIMSGKMHKVHQEISALIPQIAAIRVTPHLWASGVPEFTIRDESVKTVSVFEEQMEKELRHRKIHKEEQTETRSSPSSRVGKVNVRDLRNVGFHTVRKDFMPISHSESTMAIDNSPLQMGFNQNAYGMIMVFTIFIWMMLYSIYFPESMLVNEQ